MCVEMVTRNYVNKLKLTQLAQWSLLRHPELLTLITQYLSFVNSARVFTLLVGSTRTWSYRFMSFVQQNPYNFFQLEYCDCCCIFDLLQQIAIKRPRE